MQVIRGGHVEGHADLVTEHARIAEAFEARDLERARSAIREHIETGRRIALEAIRQGRVRGAAPPAASERR
jgi:DNA-binding GntR family transcriptional regulator